jgi:hypothetical protein
MRSAIGYFREKDHGNCFAVSPNPASDGQWGSQYPHIITVHAGHGDQGYRYADCRKTVCYVVVDEDEHGQPVVEKWAGKFIV